MTTAGAPRRSARRLAALLVAAAAGVAAGAAGGTPTRSAQLQPVIGNDSPSWSPDGRLIAFTSFRHGLGDIYVVGADGRGERRLTTHAAHDDQSAWSPDGSMIAFISSRDGNPELYVMNADGSGQRRVTSSPGREYYPTWSPDGKRIAFQSDRTGRANVWAVDLDGSDLRRLTTGELLSQRPSWSREGSIAFSSNRAGAFKVYVMDGDGENVRRFDPSASHLAELEPSWSPDGSRIAFVALRDPPVGNTEIYVGTADGTATRVTDYWGRDVSPSWAPDGRRLAFTRGPSAFRAEVWIVNVDGSGLRQLTSTAVTLQVLRSLHAPARPVAGRRFTLTAVVAEPTRDPVERAQLTCRAALGSRVLPTVVRRWQPSLVTCAWNVPAGASGRALSVGFDVRAGRSAVSHRRTLVVR
jgi:Tol biopolymer transport system component